MIFSSVCPRRSDYFSFLDKSLSLQKNQCQEATVAIIFEIGIWKQVFLWLFQFQFKKEMLKNKKQRPLLITNFSCNLRTTS